MMHRRAEKFRLRAAASYFPARNNREPLLARISAKRSAWPPFWNLKCNLVSAMTYLAELKIKARPAAGPFSARLCSRSDVFD
jgi:hypothetical protein